MQNNDSYPSTADDGPTLVSTKSKDENEERPDHVQELRFLDYTKDLSHHFESINKQWIDEMFMLEDIDKQVLSDPQEYIIDKGGRIWFAEHPVHGVVGTCALLNKGNGAFELTKMGVLSPARGLKLGEQLLQYVLAQAATLHIKSLFLLTNAKCEAAIHLYEKNGFVHSQEIMQQYGQSYERCNVAMLYIAQS
jgi:N-acetylglutamate synthase-like GNAT family acetyltransferase